MCYVQIRYAICVKTLYAHTLCYVQYAIYSMICYMIYATCNKLYAVCYLPYEWMKCFLLNIAFVALTQSCDFFNVCCKLVYTSMSGLRVCTPCSKFMTYSFIHKRCVTYGHKYYKYILFIFPEKKIEC